MEEKNCLFNNFWKTKQKPVPAFLNESEVEYHE